MSAPALRCWELSGREFLWSWGVSSNLGLSLILYRERLESEVEIEVVWDFFEREVLVGGLCSLRNLSRLPAVFLLPLKKLKLNSLNDPWRDPRELPELCQGLG